MPVAAPSDEATGWNFPGTEAHAAAPGVAHIGPLLRGHAVGHVAGGARSGERQREASARPGWAPVAGRHVAMCRERAVARLSPINQSWTDDIGNRQERRQNGQLAISLIPTLSAAAARQWGMRMCADVPGQARPGQEEYPRRKRLGLPINQ